MSDKKTTADKEEKAPKKDNGKETRTRTWTFVLYPESAPENWREILDELHIEWVESPLHDKDVNANGEPKKPHKHILLMFGGVKSYEQVKELTDSINCPIPQRCHNAKALVRYMAHIDNPEKAQYSTSDIVGHGGVDIADMLRPSSSERYAIIKEMMEYIKKNNIIEFQDLIDYAITVEPDTWFPLLCDNSAVVVNMYIKSQRHRSDGANKQIGDINKAVEHKKPTRKIIVVDGVSIDEQTGEVIENKKEG